MVDPLIESLRGAEAALARERLSPAATRLVARRMAAAMARKSRAWPYTSALAFAAGAALVLAVVGWKALRPAPVENPGTALVRDGDCRQRTEGDVLVLDGSCTIELAREAVRVDTRGPTLLGRVDAHTVELARGEAVFDVMPREHAIMRVLVPGGVIEVVGTRFRVVAWSTGGVVELLEGRVRFVDDRGETWLDPGDRLEFGTARVRTGSAAALAPAPAPAGGPAADPAPTIAPPVAPAKKKPAEPSAPAPAPPSEADAIVANVRALRAAGRYDVAAERLRGALARTWPPRTADILSYELGTILSRHLADPARACAHWADHLERYPSTRYADAIARSRAKLGCAD